jgi:hypothetical protein
MGEESRLVSCETETPMAIDARMINNKASPHCLVSRLAGESVQVEKVTHSP